MATTAVRSVGSIELATLEAGQGGRPLLLSHGFTGAKEDFADCIDALADGGWWVVAPDLRGHGFSSQPDEEGAYSIAIYADDLLGLVDGLGWDRFSLLGHSMGGMIAQVMALQAGDRIQRLVLMNTHHGPIQAVDADTIAIAVDVLRSQGLPALLELISLLPAAERSPSDMRARAERPGYAEFSDAKVHRCAPAMYAAMAQELIGLEDRLEALASLARPTLIVVGDEDKLMLGASHRMAEAIPCAQLAVIADAAHSPQFENPQGWWDAIAPFLSAELVVD